MTLYKSAAAGAVALLVAGPAMAQGVLVGTTALDDRIAEIEEDVSDELTAADDPARFGRAQLNPGFSGSVALGFTGNTGNVDDADLSIAGRLRYGGALIDQTLGYALEFGETDGERTKREGFAVYEATLDFSPTLYGFGLGSLRFDEFATLRSDAFLGAGVGVRLINQPGLAWRVQAGPGVRYTRDQNFDEETELAGIAASRVFFEVTETVVVTNDTDFLFSDVGTLIRNDLGVNFAITERASTRVSYRTDYNSDPLDGFESTDNRLAVALVFGF